MKNHPYRRTIQACHLGLVVQAAVLNVTPIVFITLMAQYHLSFEQLGRLALINFVTQLTVDLLCGRPVDRWGIRPFVVGGHLLASVGLIVFALAPFLFPNHVYLCLVFGTMLFSAGGGLLELLLNPIMSSIPGEETASMLSTMHSFYSWGYIAVVLATTGIMALFGRDKWYFAPLLWSLLPLFNAVNFARVPLVPPVHEDKRTKVRVLLKRPFFGVCLIVMLLGGAMEIIMGQWASSFLETAIGLPKMIGDVAGVCMFALMMGVGRSLYGKYGSKINIYRAISGCAALAVICYIAAGISQNPMICLLACALCGLGVSIIWPAGIAIAADTYPRAGALMFAFMSSAGDLGSAVGPWAVGLMADHLHGGLQFGLLISAAVPGLMLLCMRYLHRRDAIERLIE